MYLKKLEIFGFKSFADKVEFEFRDGVTAIVGPNGSGKSNVSDAIKWVLGEQKIKSLRGIKMEDVIFAGTQIRKPLGYAEVSLIIDNSSGKLPIDYNEVSITRRIFRSGESEYYINKSSCRLKDIQLLFMDTGLGKEGYSIVGQGKIDTILSSNAAERRHIFEEAAGIVKYKTRKIEAEKKLERTENNIYRVTDIISELETQITPLKRQSEKAKKYLDFREKLKKIELNLFVHRIDELKKNQQSLKLEKSDIVSNIELKINQIEENDNKYQNVKEQLNKLDTKINTLNNSLFDLSESVEKNNTDIQVSTVKIESLLNNINTLKIELEELKLSRQILIEKKDKLKEDNNEILKEIEENNNQLLQLNEIRLNYEKQKNDKINKYESIKKQNQNINNSIIENTNRLNTLNNKEIYAENIIANSFNDIDELKKELEIYKSNKETMIINRDKTKNNLTDNKDFIYKLTKDIKDLSKKYENSNNELSLYKNNLNVSKSKLNLISNNDDLKGYYYGVKMLLKAKENNKLLKSNLHNIVGNIIKVPDQFSIAIETALGSNVQNLITEDEKTAQECIKLLNANKWGRATFLPLNVIKHNNNINPTFKNVKGFINIASNLITYDKKYNNIINNLLGRVIITENLETGIQIAKNSNHKYKIVTLNGEVLLPGGAIIGGKNTKNSNGIIQRKNEINILKKDIEKYNTKIKELQRINEDIKIKLNDYNNVLKNKQDCVNENHLQNKLYEQKIIQIEDSIKKCLELIEKNENIISNNENEKINLEKQKIEINKNTTYLQKEITIMQEKDLNFNDIYSDQINDTITKINNLKIKIAQLQEKNKYIETILDEINENIILNNDNSTKKENTLRSNEKEIENLRNNIKDKESEMFRSKELRENLSKEIENSQTQKKNYNNKFDVFEKELKDLNYEKMLINESMNKLDMKLNKIQMEMDHIQENIFEDYQMNYIMAMEYYCEIENIKLETDNIKELKQKIKSLGSINVGAIEQYKSIKERYEFLSTQREDLTNAKDELNDIIKEISITMQHQFLEQFDMIQKQFSTIFNRLFNGGNAKLEICDPSNIMETGIEIVAQPPGKKLKSITLLSGGEKALTAIALLFSIIKIKPAPFCVLDEIDAALDDSNVDRFSQYLSSISKSNQFITITHRKGTMEIADRLYGISMSGDGVSKMISVEITDYLI